MRYRNARAILGRLLLKAVAAAGGIAILSGIGFRAAVRWSDYPSHAERPVPGSVRILDRNDVETAAFVSSEGQWQIPLSENEINPRLIEAIVAVEDARFYEHHGVDWKSVAAACWHDLSHPGVRRGASTLTMQLQRLRDPGPRTLSNKLQQAVRAEQLEQRLTKSQILVEYLNRAPFGGNLVGAGAAAWRYFGRPCRQLSLGEVALLAGLPQSPSRLRPDRYPARAGLRRRHVLDRMVSCGFITERERDEAAAEPITAAWRSLPQDRVAGDLPMADGALPTLLKISRAGGGVPIRSTLDAAVQRQVAGAASEHLRSLESSGIAACAVVVLDTNSSECLAGVSICRVDSLLDLTSRRRSTGSTLKPFIYGAAFDAGIFGPRSILSDTPSAWPGYQPNDYDHTFRGDISAAEALSESRNIPAMLVLSKVGVEYAVGVMDAAGMHRLAKSPDRYGLSLAIGGAEASPMELAEAYASLGRGGFARPVKLIRSDSSPVVAKQCLRPAACWQVLNALSGTARTSGVDPAAARSHVAWKTGTSSGHRDAWCAAVTRRRTVVVWVGNAGGQASAALVGQDAAAPLALRIIGMLDPSDEPWPATPDSSTATSPRRFAGASPPLVMVRPTDGEEFLLTSDLPQDRQRIRLEATGGDSLWWFVDGRPVANGTDARRLWWDPVAGGHDIRVVNSDGQSAQARVQVRISTH